MLVCICYFGCDIEFFCNCLIKVWDIGIYLLVFWLSVDKTFRVIVRICGFRFLWILIWFFFWVEFVIVLVWDIEILLFDCFCCIFFLLCVNLLLSLWAFRRLSRNIFFFSMLLCIFYCVWCVLWYFVLMKMSVWIVLLVLCFWLFCECVFCVFCVLFWVNLCCCVWCICGFILCMVFVSGFVVFVMVCDVFFCFVYWFLCVCGVCGVIEVLCVCVCGVVFDDLCWYGVMILWEMV